MNKNIKKAIGHVKEAMACQVAAHRECCRAVIEVAKVDPRTHRNEVHRWVDLAIDWWAEKSREVVDDEEDMEETMSKVVERLPQTFDVALEAARLTLVGVWHKVVTDADGYKRILTEDAQGNLPHAHRRIDKEGEEYWLFFDRFVGDGKGGGVAVTYPPMGMILEHDTIRYEE